MFSILQVGIIFSPFFNHFMRCNTNMSLKHSTALSVNWCFLKGHWTKPEIRISVNIPWAFSGHSEMFKFTWKRNFQPVNYIRNTRGQKPSYSELRLLWVSWYRCVSRLNSSKINNFHVKDFSNVILSSHLCGHKISCTYVILRKKKQDII